MSDAKGRQSYKHKKSEKYTRQFERTRINKEKRKCQSQLSADGRAREKA